MLFKLFGELFLDNSKFLEFTIGDHLKLLMFWLFAITCLHGVLLCLKTSIKVCAEPTWNLFVEMGKGIGNVYFCAVGLIGCIYYVVVMIPLLLVSSIVVGGFVPLCSGMYILGVKCGDVLDEVMVYTGIIPRMLWRVYVNICDQTLPVENDILPQRVN